MRPLLVSKGRHMFEQAREIVGEALRDFKLSWRGLAITDIAYKFLAFALISPAVT